MVGGLAAHHRKAVNEGENERRGKNNRGMCPLWSTCRLPDIAPTTCYAFNATFALMLQISGCVAEPQLCCRSLVVLQSSVCVAEPWLCWFHTSVAQACTGSNYTFKWHGHKTHPIHIVISLNNNKPALLKTGLLTNMLIQKPNCC